MSSHRRVKKVDDYLIDLNSRVFHKDGSQVYEGRMSGDLDHKVTVELIKNEEICQNSMSSSIKNAWARKVTVLKKFYKGSHIVQLEKILISKDHVYLVHNYAEQRDLRVMVRGNSKKYIHQLAKGMKQIVRHGIMHRDLCPESILFDDKDDLKIGNFSLSKTLDQSSFNTIRTRKQNGCQSYAYQSPQILMKQPYSYHCDIWSFGALCYQFEAGKLPWPPSSSPEDLQTKIQQIDQIGIAFEPDFDSDLRDLVIGCLRLKEEDRMSWKQIFAHPYLQDTNSRNKVQEFPATLYTYAYMGEKTIENNLNLKLFFDRFPQDFTPDQVSTVFKSLFPDLPTSQAQKVTQQMCRKVIKISSEQILDFLDNKGILINRVSFYEGKRNYNNYLITEQAEDIMKRIDDLDLTASDLLQMLKPQVHKERISFLEFHRLMRDYILRNPKWLQMESESIFELLDRDKQNEIGLEEMIKNLFRLIGLPAILNPEQAREVKRMRMG